MKLRTKYIKKILSEDGTQIIEAQVTIYNEQYQRPNGLIFIEARVNEFKVGYSCDSYNLERNINKCISQCNAHISMGTDVRKHIKSFGFKLKR